MRSKLFTIIAALALLGGACQTSNDSIKQVNNSAGNASTGTPGPAPQKAATALSPNAVDELKPGMNLPEININDVTGQSTTVASHADENGELLVIYDPDCHVCH